MKYLYLILNIGSVIVPLLFSFESKIKFASRWKYSLPAILLTALVFLIWDHVFTIKGIWSFNESFVSGIFLSSMPIEEWLFFLCIPYACLFTYDALGHYLPKGFSLKSSKIFLIALFFALVYLLIANYDLIYTAVVCIFSLSVITYNLISAKPYLGKFLLAYFITLIPFFIVNGILTSMPVVQYNDLENLGIRIHTIPVEDLLYWFSLFLMNVTLYEALIFKNLNNNGHAKS